MTDAQRGDPGRPSAKASRRRRANGAASPGALSAARSSGSGTTVGYSRRSRARSSMSDRSDAVWMSLGIAIVSSQRCACHERVNSGASASVEACSSAMASSRIQRRASCLIAIGSGLRTSPHRSATIAPVHRYESAQNAYASVAMGARSAAVAGGELSLGPSFEGNPVGGSPRTSRRHGRRSRAQPSPKISASAVAVSARSNQASSSAAPAASMRATASSDSAPKR